MPQTAPFLTFPAPLLLKAQGVRVAFFAFEGVLTDGRGVADDSGALQTWMHSQDRLGLELLEQVGITPVVMVRSHQPERWTAARPALPVPATRIAAFSGCTSARTAEDLLGALGMTWQQAAAMGADWPDLPVMQRAALKAAPIDAHAELRARADFVSPGFGGRGAARALCDLLTTAAGRYAAILGQHSA